MLALETVFEASLIAARSVGPASANEHSASNAMIDRWRMLRYEASRAPRSGRLHRAQAFRACHRALIGALKTGHIGSAGLDVYEEGVFEDPSDQGLQDDVLARLLTFPNVLVNSHQGFLTREALAAIATTTLANVTAFERGEPLVNEVRADVVRPR